MVQYSKASAALVPIDGTHRGLPAGCSNHVSLFPN